MEKQSDKVQKKPIDFGSEGKVINESIERASKLALILALPALLLFALPYVLIWKYNPLHDITFSSAALLLIIIIPGAILHELIHGFFFAVFAKNGFSAISFGFKVEYLTPYCHCKVPVKVWHYCVGGLAPLLILGIAPGIAGIVLADFHVLLFGIFFTWAASGDILSVWMLRRFKAGMWVQDHPEELGFVVYESYPKKPL